MKPGSVTDWFEHQDYEKGVMLYEKLAPGTPLISLFRVGCNSFTEKKLYEELKKLLPPPSPDPDGDQPGERDEIPTWTEEQKRMFRERATAHAQMKSATNVTDRRALAFRVLAITDRIEKTLKGPIPAADLPEDRSELVKLRNNNRSYISKNQNHPKRQLEVNRRRLENEIIEKRLNES